MADGPSKTDSPKRWPRGQRFTVTPEGTTAQSALKEAITTARAATGGRDAQDAVVGSWASRYGVSPGDGVCLEELASHDRSVPELAESLLEAGLSRSDIQNAVDRLVTAGLVAAVPKPDAGGGPMPPSGSYSPLR